MRIRPETYAIVFDTVYAALVTNVLLIVGCLPLVATLVLTDPARSWPLIALVAPLCAPGLCGVFAVLSAFSRGRTAEMVGTFGRTWRACLRSALILGGLTTAALVVLGVDARAAWTHPAGAIALPVLVVVMALVVSTALLGMVVLAERPTVRVRLVLRACLYLAVRHWYLTVVSLVVLALLAALVVSRPAIALGLAAAPLLYVIWANSRFALRAALESGVARQA